MIRVGFVTFFDDGWLGGINYFRNLFTAIYDDPERGIEVVVFTGIGADARHFEGFPKIKIIRSAFFDRGSVAWVARKVWRRLFINDWLFERVLKRHDVDVLSHFDWLGKRSAIPAIGWVPDFQHVHLPYLFDAKEIISRDRAFHDLCKFCELVIVSSVDAQNDLHCFAPVSEKKSEVLQFVAARSSLSAALSAIDELELRYKFSGKFFLLPNQFWKHKNHQIVIDALAVLAQEGKQVLVLATGNTRDNRHPGYFDKLTAHARDCGVLDQFLCLGLVPERDLTLLMSTSVAIINPSFFEGWSTSVEEAKTLGKRVILSNIAVHREQNPFRADYFSPDSKNELAAILWKVWNAPGEDEKMRAMEAIRLTEMRRIAFARRYHEIILRALRIRKKHDQAVTN